MGGRCEQQITLAMEALDDRDDELARKVIEDDAAIDRDENEIDELALQILATRQPVASRPAVHHDVAQVRHRPRAHRRSRGRHREARARAQPPAAARRRTSISSARRARPEEPAAPRSIASSRKDADRATAVIMADREIDKLNASLFAELLAHVATDPATVTRVLPLTSVCRYLERIGDHVKNLAEEVVYMVRAQTCATARRRSPRINSPLHASAVREQ